ncbi:DUF1801 domain-containing protein [Microbacterium sp. SS28]|uniref:DUF1801 domain-containing protein n=1 Tax=Microbacterium sp. SS28 TaxID=2919948 RepID=UPI001FAA73D8|nr:DUF1801 domain-containing protein [Microbacterium sp. SS28]
MPARFATVDDFLDALTAERRAEVESLRALVLEAEPELIEILKWNSPDYTLRGIDRLTINAPGKGPVRLILHFGADRPENKDEAPAFGGDPSGLLTWHSNIWASLTLPQPDDLTTTGDAIIAVVRAWLAEE